jgi:hypothetical protein
MPPRPSGNANDAAAIAAAMTRASFCLECIATKTSLSVVRIQRLLETIAGTVRVTRRRTRCEGCLRTKPVFRLA